MQCVPGRQGCALVRAVGGEPVAATLGRLLPDLMGEEQTRMNIGRGLSLSPDLPTSISRVHGIRQLKEMPGRPGLCVQKGGPDPGIPTSWGVLGIRLSKRRLQVGAGQSREAGSGVNQTHRVITGNQLLCLKKG